MRPRRGRRCSPIFRRTRFPRPGRSVVEEAAVVGPADQRARHVGRFRLAAGKAVSARIATSASAVATVLVQRLRIPSSNRQIPLGTSRSPGAHEGFGQASATLRVSAQGSGQASCGSVFWRLIHRISGALCSWAKGARVDPVRTVVVDDSLLIRQGIVRLLDFDPGVEVVGRPRLRRPGRSRRSTRLEPDVVLTDIRMPPTHTDEGVVLAHHARERSPRTGVLVLSQHLSPSYAIGLLGHGSEGRGYLLKDRFTTSRRSRARCASWPRVAARSTRSSSRL